MFSLKALIFSLLTAIAGVLYYSYTSLSYRPPCHNSGVSAPRSVSWKIWLGSSPTPCIGNDDDWSLHHHLGGYGPWVSKLTGEPEPHELDPLDGCSIDQIHMMSRHAERYPTKSAGSRVIALLNKMIKAEVPLNGSLSFLNNWAYLTSSPHHDFDQLTTTGPHAGTAGAFRAGMSVLARYGHLIADDSKTTFWASDSERVIKSAHYFALGLFGPDWEKSGKATLEIIPESFDRRADTLTPGDTCLKYIEDKDQGHDNGMKMLTLFQQAYIPAIAERLIVEQDNPALETFTNWEVFSMQEMCGFETILRGSSPWCDVFTREDWENFEYGRDLVHYYRGGPGNPYAGAMGWLWLNATTNLLREGPQAGATFFSFVHDGDIAPFLTALDIMRDTKYDPFLPTTHRLEDRVWYTSTVMPMGGRVTLERMTCSPTDGVSDMSTTFLRVNINDKIVPLPYCNSGPGLSCPLEEFFSHVARRRIEVGEFGEVCGLDDDVGRITFLRQAHH